jgi:hypothetical protein
VCLAQREDGYAAAPVGPEAVEFNDGLIRAINHERHHGRQIRNV